MNTHDNHNDNHNHNDDNGGGADRGIRPLGSWLRAVDALLARAFATAFAGEDIDRREWMLLNAVSGDVAAPGLAERLARRGKRLGRLERRGWVEQVGDGTWTLTDAGRAAKERLGAAVDGIRARVSGAVSPEDFATTLASLEAIARELGWSEDERMPHRRHGRGFPRPFGPEIGFGFGPNRHHGFRTGFGPGGGPASSERGRGAASFERSTAAYERGFDAGFARGRDSAA